MKADTDRLSMKEAAAYCGFSTPYLSTLAREGRIGSQKRGGRREFLQKDLDHFLKNGPLPRSMRNVLPVRLSDRDRMLLELAARPEGLNSSKVPGLTSKQVGARVGVLVKAGLLVTVRISARAARHFTTQELADAFSRIPAAAPKKKKNGEVCAPAGEAIYPENYKYSVGPSPAPPASTAPTLLTDKPPCTSRAGAEDFRKHQRPGRY